ncbi:hypothetical protein PDJAM_G00132080 [Pangasius djambal]|uniref:Uncharacterized protein n=1 Tax=Pangasius djambal TaxID=1691987 RepID=A0ACC5ZCL5_9TELE|nr:hypothetical protein [Pangasius djambal]
MNRARARARRDDCTDSTPEGSRKKTDPALSGSLPTPATTLVETWKQLAFRGGWRYSTKRSEEADFRQYSGLFECRR